MEWVKLQYIYTKKNNGNKVSTSALDPRSRVLGFGMSIISNDEDDHVGRIVLYQS